MNKRGRIFLCLFAGAAVFLSCAYERLPLGACFAGACFGMLAVLAME